MLINMQLSDLLLRSSLKLLLRWRPRDENQYADQLTNEIFTNFSDKHRIAVAYSDLPLSLLHQLWETKEGFDSARRAQAMLHQGFFERTESPNLQPRQVTVGLRSRQCQILYEAFAKLAGLAVLQLIAANMHKERQKHGREAEEVRNLTWRYGGHATWNAGGFLGPGTPTRNYLFLSRASTMCWLSAEAEAAFEDGRAVLSGGSDLDLLGCCQNTLSAADWTDDPIRLRQLVFQFVFATVLGKYGKGGNQLPKGKGGKADKGKGKGGKQPEGKGSKGDKGKGKGGKPGHYQSECWYRVQQVQNAGSDSASTVAPSTVGPSASQVQGPSAAKSVNRVQLESPIEIDMTEEELSIQYFDVPAGVRAVKCAGADEERCVGGHAAEGLLDFGDLVKVLALNPHGSPKLPNLQPVTTHLACTDLDGEWTICHGECLDVQCAAPDNAREPCPEELPHLAEAIEALDAATAARSLCAVQRSSGAAAHAEPVDIEVVVDSGSDASCLPMSWGTIGQSGGADSQWHRDAQGNRVSGREMRTATIEIAGVKFREHWLLSSVTQPLFCFGKLMTRNGWDIIHDADRVPHLTGPDARVCVPLFYKNYSLRAKGFIQGVTASEADGQPGIRALVSGPWLELSEEFHEVAPLVYARRDFSDCFVDCSVALSVPHLSLGVQYRTTLVQDGSSWDVIELNQDLSLLEQPEAEFEPKQTRHVITIASCDKIDVDVLFNQRATGPPEAEQDTNMSEAGLPELPADSLDEMLEDSPAAGIGEVDPGEAPIDADASAAPDDSDAHTGACTAIPTPAKGGSVAFRFLVAELCKFISFCGHSEVTLRSDGELTCRALQQGVKGFRDKLKLVTQVEKDSHEGNPAEQAVEQLRQLTGTLLSQVEHEMGQKISTMSPIHAWAWKHAAWLHTRYARTEAHSPFEIITGRPYLGKLVNFCEVVYARVKSSIKGKARWVKMISLGKLGISDLHFGATQGGFLISSRSVRRLPKQFDANFLEYVHALDTSLAHAASRAFVPDDTALSAFLPPPPLLISPEPPTPSRVNPSLGRATEPATPADMLPALSPVPESPAPMLVEESASAGGDHLLPQAAAMDLLPALAEQFARHLCRPSHQPESD
ncbi:GIP [Symbiodinium sp. CCMP2592]|nr:GIP [Symbiodinium sp. CCMP2592]